MIEAPKHPRPCPQAGNDPCVWPRCNCPGGIYHKPSATETIEVEQAAQAIRFMFEMFSLDGDMESWIAELRDDWPTLAEAVSRQEAALSATERETSK